MPSAGKIVGLVIMTLITVAVGTYILSRLPFAGWFGLNRQRMIGGA